MREQFYKLKTTPRNISLTYFNIINSSNAEGF